jgi:NSS family neurotransmitter:Na+ symporter
MSKQKSSLNEHWSSKWAFIFAAAGSAVGLGNIWKFPYITGDNGGGAFVLVYLACVLVIGLPLLIAEIYLGRLGQENPVDAIRNIIKIQHLKKFWVIIGWIALIGSFLILSYYCVIAGWTLDYTVKSVNGSFTQMTPLEIDNLFTSLLAHPIKLIGYYTLTIALTGLIISQGISKGIEKATYVLFPVMVLILIALVIYAMRSGSFLQGFNFMFHPNFAKLSGHSVLSAMGHAFFSLSLGLGALMMYGAYLPKKVSIGYTAVWIAAIDTAIALLAGLAIFPIVFAHHLEPSAGPGLIFKTLPLAFASLPYGHFFAALFFIMLVIAALTSTISLLEPLIAFMLKRSKLTRVKATIITCIAVWIVGLPSLFSFNVLANLKFLAGNFFENIDYLTANLMLPVNGLLLGLLATWGIQKAQTKAQLHLSPTIFTGWYNVLKFFTPICIVIVLISGIC